MQKRKAIAFLIAAILLNCFVITNSKIVFKDYNPKQELLFPSNLSELIEAKHPVRLISDIIDRLDISAFEQL